MVSQAAGAGIDSSFRPGSQFASHAFRDKLAEYGMRSSMSRKADCWDNAPAESSFNSLKNERVQGTRYATREEAIADLFDYIEVFTTGVAATPRSAITRRFSSCCPRLFAEPIQRTRSVSD
jgi:transposase InsO family protein